MAKDMAKMATSSSSSSSSSSSKHLFCHKKHSKMTKEIFPPPTKDEKKELAVLRIELAKISPTFNIFQFIRRVKRLQGYCPPIDAMIKISKSALKSRPKNMWGYFVKALQQEQPKRFAELNIKEHEQYKKMPVGNCIGDIMKKMGQAKSNFPSDHGKK